MQKNKVIILKSAEYDLQELKKHIVRYLSLKARQTTYHALKETILHLQHFPQTGAIPAKLEKLNRD